MGGYGLYVRWGPVRQQVCQASICWPLRQRQVLVSSASTERGASPASGRAGVGRVVFGAVPEWDVWEGAEAPWVFSTVTQGA